MKHHHVRLVFLEALSLLMFAACGPAPHPNAPDDDVPPPAQTGPVVDRSLELIYPRLWIVPKRTGGYNLAFEAHAVGTHQDSQMVALRSLRSIDFEIYASDGSRLDSLSTEEITTSGIRDSRNNASSLTASAGVVWSGSAPGGSVLMVVHSDRGIFAVREDLPPAAR